MATVCSCYLRQGGYVFIGVRLFVCLFGCQQDDAKTTQPIFTEFGVKFALDHGERRNR